jgi:TPR repeat protein
MKMFRHLALATVLGLSAVDVSAQDFEKGVAAANSGDFETALKEWLPLAEQGNSWAQYGVGKMFRRGNGVDQDYVEALKWYRLSAHQGFFNSQFELGAMYALGQGVLQDYVRSHMWYNVASVNGSGFGGTERDEIAAKMTPEDISKAQAMASECVSSDYQNCSE